MYGLDDQDIQMIKSDEVDWDIRENQLVLWHCEGGHRYACELTDDQVDELLNAYRFESRARNGGIESVAFVPGQIHDWAGVAPDSNWEGFVNGYVNAANALHKAIPNDSIEPYLFLCRHTLELTLKGVIMLGQESLGLIQDLPDHHDLCRLWTAALPILLIKGKLSAEQIDLIRSVVDEYHSMDAGSFSFRYPVSKRNKKINHDDRLQSFSLEKQNGTFREVVGCLHKVVKNLKMGIVLSKAWRNTAQHGD
jgi:hypothetical protein